MTQTDKDLILSDMASDCSPWWEFPRRPAAVRMFVAVGVAHGLTPERCLQGTGVAASMLEETTVSIDAHQELTAARNLVRALGDPPGLGAEAGRRFKLGDIGVLGFAMISSRCCREAIELGVRHASLSSMYTKGDLEVSPAAARIVLDDSQIPADVHDFLVERDVSAIAQIVPLTVGGDPRLHPVWLELNLSPRRRSAVARELPGIPVKPARRSAVVIRPDVLDLPLPTADPEVAKLCLRECEGRREQIAGGTAARVRGVLVRNAAAMPTMEQAAATLHINARTLHRRLAEEGMSFRTLVDDVRKSVATELLSNSLLTVDEVSKRLGYSEPAAFSRAFTRWAGYPPSQVQRGAEFHGT